MINNIRLNNKKRTKPFNFDFLDYKVVFGYVIIISMSLLSGYYLKDAIAFIYVTLILYFCIIKNISKAIEIFIIWFTISNFFVGQGYIMFEVVSKYIAKPSFLLFVIFLFFINNIPTKFFKANYTYTWIVFLILTLLSSITQNQSPFVIITISSFFLFFLLMQSRAISNSQYAKYLNLFVAIAVIQTIVSLLQVTNLIAPPSAMMPDGSGGYFKWEAGIDDVASGTFGPAASATTSWYIALISLFMIIMWAHTKKIKYLIALAISFIQFATVDSKTILGITIVMILFSLIRIIYRKNKFKLNLTRISFFLIVLSVGVYGFIKAWNSYYEYTGKITGGSRTDVNAVYNTEIKESFYLVVDNFQDWGKIKGYQYIFEDFLQNNPIQLIWGYGIQGYDYNGKMGYIQSKDTHLMQLNNITNSTSGLITQFAVSGLVGFLMFTISLIFWFKRNRNSANNKYGLIHHELINIYFPFSILAMFIYGNNLNSIPIIISVAIFSIYSKLSSRNQLIIKRN